MSAAAVLEMAPPKAQPAWATLSASKLRDWMTCQVLWRNRHAEKRPAAKTAALAFGSAAHWAIGKAYAHKMHVGEDLPAAWAAAEFRRAWNDEAQTVEFRKDEKPLEICMKGERLVSAYMLDCAPGVEPVAVEMEVSGEWAGVKVRGRLDVLTDTGEILDLKTTCQKPARISVMNAVQLATYATFTAGASGLVRLDALVKGRNPDLVSIRRTLTDKDVSQLRLYPLAQRAMRAAEGNYQPNFTSKMCSRRQCPYWADCEQEFGVTIPEFPC